MTPPAPAVARSLLIVAAAWTGLGAVPGFFDPAASFLRFNGVPPATALELELYRGAWGQTLLFALGYLVASTDPRRHALVVALGAVGKLLYAGRLVAGFAAGASPAPLPVVAVVGDLLLAGLMGWTVVPAVISRPAREPGTGG